MCMRVPSSFQTHFATLSAPRSFHAPNLRHELLDILVLAVCAVICGAEGWEDIEEYGTAQAAWFAEVLDLPHGIPGHDTFRRVLAQLDPEELPRRFVAWTTALSALSGGDVESRRAIGEKVQIERRYYFVALPADAKRFGDAVRQHWGGEHGLPWGLDVSFHEDACRIRKAQGAQTFSVLRHIALNLLKRETQHKRGIKARRRRAGWDRDYLLQVLTG